MQVDVYSDDYSQKFVEIHYKNLEIDFFMTLDENDASNPNMTLNMDWREIKIESAHVVPIVKSLDSSKLNDNTVRDYLNWSFKLILPWVHSYKPENVAFFNLPKKFPSLLEIHHITLEVRDNYLNFGLFLWFFTSGLNVQAV